MRFWRGGAASAYVIGSSSRFGQLTFTSSQSARKPNSFYIQLYAPTHGASLQRAALATCRRTTATTTVATTAAIIATTAAAAAIAAISTASAGP